MKEQIEGRKCNEIGKKTIFNTQDVKRTGSFKIAKFTSIDWEIVSAEFAQEMCSSLHKVLV